MRLHLEAAMSHRHRPHSSNEISHPHLRIVWSNDHPESPLDLPETECRKPPNIGLDDLPLGFALAAAILHVTPETLQAQWEILDVLQTAEDAKEGLWSRIRRWFRPGTPRQEELRPERRPCD